VAKAIERRRRELQELRVLARDYVAGLAGRLPVRAAAIAGSVARGDFNVWSDVDVVIVSDALPERIPDRGLVLVQDAPGRVQPVGYTAVEFEQAFRRGDRLAREAVEAGVVLLGDDFFAHFRARRPAPPR
jgi:predicted nucleotidyltransferase